MYLIKKTDLNDQHDWIGLSMDSNDISYGNESDTMVDSKAHVMGQNEPVDYMSNWIDTANRQDLVAIFENTPFGITIYDLDHLKLLYVNKIFLDFLGISASEMAVWDKVIAKWIPDVRHQQCLTRRRDEMARTGIDEGRLKSVDKNGQPKIIEIHSVYLQNKCVASVWKDVTNQVTAEKELKNREAMFRSFFENSFEAAFMLADDTLVRCNPAAERLFGCEKKGQLLKATLADLSPPAQPDGQSSVEVMQQAMATARESQFVRFEVMMRRMDGFVFPAEISLSIINREGVLYTVVRDITAWKNTEQSMLEMNDQLEERLRERTSGLMAANEQLRKEIRHRKQVEKELERSREELRRLSEHIQNTREEERTYVAREVHDQLGQMLSALKIDVNCLGKQLPENLRALQLQTRKMEHQIDAAIQSVRDICAELRPPILWDFGLPATIEWYLDAFERRTGIQCKTIIDSDMPTDMQEIGLLLFRILQEAMTNIMRHSKASHVAVRLTRKKQHVTLRVRDDGIGITDQQLSNPRSFGIIGIRERVRFRGGRASFKGTTDRGTTITVTIPFDGLDPQRIGLTG